MGQVEGNNDSNRNNDIILDGRQLLPTQRHFSSPIITFAACLNFAYFQTNFQITKCFYLGFWRFHCRIYFWISLQYFDIKRDID